MDWELMQKVFDPIKRFRPDAMERGAFVDLLHLLNPRTGVPDMTQLIAQISRSIEFQQIIDIPLLPCFLNVEGEAPLEIVELERLQKMLGFEPSYL